MTTKMQKMVDQFVKLTPRDVMSVYSGKPGKCCCGCAGNHRYSRLNRQAASSHRGYRVDDDEVNDRQVAKVLTLVQDRAKVVGVDDRRDRNLETCVSKGPNHYATEVGGRLYIVYPVHSPEVK